VAGTILAYYMLHEPITIPFMIGAFFIFGGIFVAEGRLHYHPFQKLKTRK
jgi:drug/metabolite transporter (DMT)-like permease